MNMVGLSKARRRLGFLWISGLFLFQGLTGCMPPPPPDHQEEICRVFRQYPHWYRAAKRAQNRWSVPVPVQMAIVHQESHFDAYARPPRIKLLGFIPWKHQTTALGYSQALDGTWDLYLKSEGVFWASRNNFSDAVDFIGWYANVAHRMAKVPLTDAYRLYLAYHEGIGGYQRGTYWRKHWLPPVARKVERFAALYRQQLKNCRMT